ncbi:MAG: hypothetical protein MUC63_04580, partial [Planctomycetes bacterium]|nr:hypothetical protein [Planctomycetota bacterium]
MFCTHCGSSLPEGGRFCATCGSPASPAPAAQASAGPGPYPPPPPLQEGGRRGGCGIAGPLVLVAAVVGVALLALAGVIGFAFLSVGQKQKAEAFRRAAEEREDQVRARLAAEEAAAAPGDYRFPGSPQAPPPVDPAFRELRADGENGWTWLAPQETGSLRVFFDNGTDGAIAVTVGGKGEIPVESLERAALRTGPGLFRFAVADAAGAVVDEISCPLESGRVYVYNPGARWDYEVMCAT